MTTTQFHLLRKIMAQYRGRRDGWTDEILAEVYARARAADRETHLPRAERMRQLN